MKTAAFIVALACAGAITVDINRQAARFKSQIGQLTQERDAARKDAAMWRRQEEACYPLVKQWRTGYDALRKQRGCK